MLVVVVVLVVVKLTGTSTTPPPSNGPAPQALPSSTAAEVTGVPASVFNAVGISSPTVPVSRARAITGQPPLTSGGRPEVLYVGAEFCPYCAAERWPLVVALSRFGTLSGLGTMQSNANGAFPNLQTLTFATTTYKSRYVAFVSRERYSDQQNSAGTAFVDFQLLDPAEASVFDRYDVPARTGQPKGTLAFVDVGNRYVSAGSSFPPSFLSGLSRNQIANGLIRPQGSGHPGRRGLGQRALGADLRHRRPAPRVGLHKRGRGRGGPTLGHRSHRQPLKGAGQPARRSRISLRSVSFRPPQIP